MRIPINLTSDSGNTIYSLITPTIRLDNSQTWKIAVWSFSYFWSFYNISAEKQNNIFKFNYLGVDRQLTLSDGLYDIFLFQSSIALLLQNNSFPPNLFIFSADIASGRVIVQINALATTIQWTLMNTSNDSVSLAEINGFISDSTVLVSGEYAIAQQEARYNIISQINLMCDCVQGFFSRNTNNPDNIESVSSQLLYPSMITASIGMQVTDRPNVPIYTFLNSHLLDNITVWMTDQNNNKIENNNPWNVCLLISDQD